MAQRVSWRRYYTQPTLAFQNRQLSLAIIQGMRDLYRTQVREDEHIEDRQPQRSLWRIALACSLDGRRPGDAPRPPRPTLPATRSAAPPIWSGC